MSDYLTPPIPALVQDLLIRLRHAKYPAQYDVSREEYEAVETYLQATIDLRRAEWRAAGSPEDWPYDLGPMYVGRHFGVMLKNVELMVAAP